METSQINLNDPFEMITDLETSFSLNKGFFENLYTEDDWSFIIKLNALFEAAISDLITTALKDERLHKFASNLHLADKEKGKLAILKDLNLVPASFRGYILKLASLRNKIVHNVSHVSIDLCDYFKRGNNASSYAKEFSLGISNINFDSKDLSNTQYFLNDPKQYVWLTSLICLAIIRVRQYQIAEKKNLRSELAQKENEYSGMLKVLEKLSLLDEE